MKAVRRALPYAAVALAAYGVLFSSLRLGERDLRVPFAYGGDALFYTVVTKAVSEGGFSRFERLGAPFGMDLFDWPTGMLFDLSVLGLLARLLGEASLALNLYWLASVVLTVVLAAWAMRRLGLEATLAFPLGLLYGLLPYAFYRNIWHVSMAYHFVPLLALLLVRVVEGHPERAGLGERRVTAMACVLQGLSYPYYGFFAAALLVVAGAVGSLRTRGWASARAAVVAVALLGSATAVNLGPSVLYWRTHGANAELNYKSIGDSDGYGLKIRHLVTPILDHPLPPFRWVAWRIANAGFPLENENTTAKVGLVASVGFLLLLGVSVAGAGRFGDVWDPLPGLASLNLAAVLLATIGGFGSIFAVFVSAQIRAWNRIAVFNAFFGLMACGVVLRVWLAHTRASGRSWARFAPTALGALLSLAVFDQLSTSHLVGRMEDDAARYARDEAFVRRVERLLPPGSLVFQLPHTPTPVDASVGPMQAYDNSRAYLHSRTLAWSWGAISGRHGNWQAEVARLPPAEMVRRLVLAGFAAVVIDRFGWARGSFSPYARGDSNPEGAIAAAAGLPVEASSDGRYALVLLSGVRQALETALGPDGVVRASRQALRAPVIARWPRGFSVLEGDGTTNRRLGGMTARLVFKNPLSRPRRIQTAARIQALDPRGGTLRLSGLLEETLALGEHPVEWRRTLLLPPATRARIDFAFEGLAACPEVERCFQVVDFSCWDLDDVSLSVDDSSGEDQEPRISP
jgi:phosphoglycerol transferase